MAWSDRFVLLAGSCCLLLLAACGPSGAGEETSDSSGNPSPDPSAPMAAEPSQTPNVSNADAAKEFILVVCPADTALQSLIGTATEAGGWSAVSRKDAERYALGAADAARAVASMLPEREWPESVAVDIPVVVDEYLATLRPLQQIAQAGSGSERSAGWRDLQGQVRPAEERVRLALKLGSMNSEKDGCPLPTKTSGGSSSRKPSSGGSDAVAAGWTEHWTSPSGNIRCGFNPRGKTGTAVVACVVANQSQLMLVRAGGFVEGPEFATDSDFAQLTSSSAARLNFGDYWFPPGFTCWQSYDDGMGMTCWDNGTRRGFAVKQDSYQFVS